MEEKKRFPVITMCGSTRFKEEFIHYTKVFSLAGAIVISVGLFGHEGDIEAFQGNHKAMLDAAHLQKIDMSDAIFVINKDGYIGESTKREIQYAKDHNKTIIYLEKPSELITGNSDDCKFSVDEFKNTFKKYLTEADFEKSK